MGGLADYERVPVETRAGWRAWLEENHRRPVGVWVVSWKKTSGGPHVSVADISEEALCFGWVDSLPRALDDRRSMLLVTPRKPGSNWSKLNRDRVARLEDDGRMAPAGLAAVARARADGTWTALDGVEALDVPADLDAALVAVPAALATFSGFPRSTRRGILEWLLTARTVETRQRRIALIAAMASQGLRANFPADMKAWRAMASGDGSGSA